ncbi:hypothetical protein [Mycobacterium kyogaense]|uniref:hypothetical protein n=1 Tax=Mycobacterium kyogaense TaxID=2212479 RepID=UPI000DACC266|nr:hypothetical protein [Mycobacterium kyogaense]
MTEPSYLDPARTRHLCDVGMPGYLLSIALEYEGTEQPLLVQLATLFHPTRSTYQRGQDVAPHDQLGPLPERIQERVALSPLRCARQTKRGRRCRAIVHQPGTACARHTDAKDRAAR